jgi:hypothetical protein
MSSLCVWGEPITRPRGAADPVCLRTHFGGASQVITGRTTDLPRAVAIALDRDPASEHSSNHGADQHDGQPQTGQADETR